MLCRSNCRQINVEITLHSHTITQQTVHTYKYFYRHSEISRIETHRKYYLCVTSLTGHDYFVWIFYVSILNRGSFIFCSHKN